jgi:hypothetical protein
MMMSAGSGRKVGDEGRDEGWMGGLQRKSSFEQKGLLRAVS